MALYRIHREVDNTNYHVIAPGPATACMIAMESWGLHRAVLHCYDMNDVHQGIWSAA